MDERERNKFAKEDERYINREMKRREVEDNLMRFMTAEQSRKVMEKREERIVEHIEHMDKKYPRDKF